MAEDPSLELRVVIPSTLICREIERADPRNQDFRPDRLQIDRMRTIIRTVNRTEGSWSSSL